MVSVVSAYIGLGSNLQDPQGQLQAALRALDAIADTRLIAHSPLYRSRAVGPGEQPDYLNGVARLATSLPALSLLDELQAIENTQGRVRAIRWGARTLDLDLLLYGTEAIIHPRLEVPHPHLQDRNFVVYPLADVAEPNLLLPDGTELVTLLSNCPRDGLLGQPFKLEL
jgi:2-amino-4-hydroxy-6-hydroxymethyldihydropteridine diphosphokinase